MYEYIIAAGIFFGIFPILGKKLYGFTPKKIGSALIIGIAALTAVTMMFVMSINPPNGFSVLLFPAERILAGDYLYIFLISVYFLGGMGLFGSAAERSGERIEEIGLYSHIKKMSTPSEYFWSAIYGYLFVLNVYAGTSIIHILLGVRFIEQYIFIDSIFGALLLKGAIPAALGIFLFSVKAFLFGFFSREYWKYNLSTRERELTWYRFIRRLIALSFCVFSLYFIAIIYLLEYYGISPPVGGDIWIMTLRFIFYIGVIIQGAYFYTHREKLIESLKSEDEKFGKKIDNNIKIDEEDILPI